MLYGKKIHVVLSKHAQVQMPQAGSNVSVITGSNVHVHVSVITGSKITLKQEVMWEWKT